MARAGYADVVTDSFGNRLAGASVEVRQPGTSAPVAGPLYAGPTGMATLSNPFRTNSLGAFVFYRAAPETVDLYVTAPGYTALTVSGVALTPDAPVLDGAQLVAGSVTDGQIAAANKDGAAGVPSLRTLGSGAQQAAAGNHGHAHASLSGIGANDHHAQVHALGGADHSGGLALGQYAVVPQARVLHSGSQIVPHGSPTALVFDSEAFDSDNLHDEGTPTRLVCRTAGLYWVWGHVGFAPNGAGSREVRIVHNTAGILGREIRPNNGGGYYTLLGVGTAYRLSVGQYVELYAYQDSGGALAVDALPPYAPVFGMVWLSP
jgi:hypothetical protein